MSFTISSSQGAAAFETTDPPTDRPYIGPYPGTFTHIKASHQDFRGLVTNDDPARPGEIVHIYLTGLGPVTPAQPDGVPAPLDPLATTDAPVSVKVVSGIAQYDQNQWQIATVLFAGLVPGTVGLYQVDMAVPDTWPDSPLLRFDVPGSVPAYLPNFAIGYLDLAQ